MGEVERRRENIAEVKGAGHGRLEGKTKRRRKERVVQKEDKTTKHDKGNGTAKRG